MSRRTKLALAGIGAAGGVGLWLGYRYAEFGVPGATIPALRDAGRAARREQAA